MVVGCFLLLKSCWKMMEDDEDGEDGERRWKRMEKDEAEIGIDGKNIER